MGSNKVCSIGLDNHTAHFDRAQMDRVCSRWSTLIERAGHRSVRVCSTWPTLTESVGHRSIRSFMGSNKVCSIGLDNHTAHFDRAQMDRVCSRWSTLIERAGHRSVLV